MDEQARLVPRSLPPLLFLILVSLLLGSTQLYAAAPTAEEKTITIRGKVVDDDDKPVSGATVSGSAVVTQKMGLGVTILASEISKRTTDAKGEFAAEVKLGADGSVSIILRARLQAAFMAQPLKLGGDQSKNPVTLRISPKNARSLRVRVIDEEGKPVAGAKVTAQQHQTAPENMRTFAPSDIELKADRTDAQGKLETPRSMEPDGNYQLQAVADGFLDEKTAWKAIGADPVLVFDDVVLKKIRSLQGQLRDTQGKAISGARVFYGDSRQRVEAMTDDSGRFSLKTAFSPPGFLFFEKVGYRFHGQRCDRPEPLTVVLRRRDDPVQKPFPALPPALPRSERKALAVRLLEPQLRAVLEKGSDDVRLRPLQALAKVDPGRLLEELEKRPLPSAWYDGYIRRDAAKALLPDNLDEARSIIDSMRDPGFRCVGYLDLYDALPKAKRTEKLALLDQAFLHSRGVVENDKRVIDVAWVARRYWSLGEKERATKLLREGQEIAKELPTAAWAGYARGAFAEDLALIDLPGALELMKDLKDQREYVRHHGNLAEKLAMTRPEEAQRIYDMLAKLPDRRQAFQSQRCAVVISYRMAAADLPRARKIADTIEHLPDRAWAFGLMAKARAKGDPKEAHELLDKALEILTTHSASGADNFNGLYDAAVIAGVLIPIAEQIQPSSGREVFWKALSFRYGPKKQDGPESEQMVDAAGALAIVLALYDRGLAMTFIERTERNRTPDQFTRHTHLNAAALANPRRAVELVENLPKGPDFDYVREGVIGWLLREADTIRSGVLGASGLGDPDVDE
jgi:hypothetical protein